MKLSSRKGEIIPAVDNAAAVCYPEHGTFVPGRKVQMALGLHPLLQKKGGGIMSDFEMLSLVIMIITLVLGALSTKIK